MVGLAKGGSSSKEGDIIAPELILGVFIIYHNLEGALGDLRREDDLHPIHQEERRLPGGSTWWCAVGPKHARKLINPTLVMLFEAVVGLGLQSLEDLGIGLLNLAIATRVSLRGIAHLDPNVIAVALECLASKLSTSICDKLVRDPKVTYDGLDEHGNWFLVDGNH
jgi:hypothetical protein